MYPLAICRIPVEYFILSNIDFYIYMYIGGPGKIGHPKILIKKS